MPLRDIYGFEKGYELEKKLLINSVKSLEFAINYMKYIPEFEQRDIASLIKQLSIYKEDPEVETLVLEKGLDYLDYFQDNPSNFSNAFTKLLQEEPFKFINKFKEANPESEANFKDFQKASIKFLNLQSEKDLPKVIHQLRLNLRQVIPFLGYKDEQINKAARSNFENTIKKVKDLKDFNLIYQEFSNQENKINSFNKEYLKTYLIEKADELSTRLYLEAKLPEINNKPNIEELQKFTKAMLDLEPEAGRTLLNFAVKAVSEGKVSFNSSKILRDIQLEINKMQKDQK